MGTVNLPVSTATFAGASGVGQFAITTSDSINVQVTYTYTTTNVPEPKVYGALGAVVCLGLLGYRQYRLKNS